jgi:hypothetical protein
MIIGRPEWPFRGTRIKTSANHAAPLSELHKSG